MAGLYLLLFVSSYYMMGLPRISNGESTYDFHKTLGVTVMSLLLARIFVLLFVLRHKYRHRQPQRSRKWLRTSALHLALYFFMVLVPLSGYLAANAPGDLVIIFGTDIMLPHLEAVNRQLVEFSGNAHFWLAYAFLAFIVLHVADQIKYLRAQGRRLFKAAIRPGISRIRDK